MMEWLEAYQVPHTEIHFDGAWSWENGKHALLLNRTGHILLVDQKLLRSLKEHNCYGELAFKMLQRGFAHLAQEENDAFADEFEIQPVYFMIDFTNRCNMACLYCLRDCDREKSEEKIISRDMLIKIAERMAGYCAAHQIGRISIQPWGGEPLLEREKIFYLQDELKRRGVEADFTIETNGLLLSPKVLAELSMREIHVSISMDGNREIHNRQRVLINGNPSHDLVEEAVKRLKQTEGPDTPILATITRLSADRVEELLEYFAVDLGIRRVKLNFVHKSSFVDNEELCLSSEEISDCTVRIFKKVLELGERGYEIFDYNIYTKLSNLVLDTKSDICLCRGCNGGKKMLTIDCRGDIFPCDISDYPEEKIGNIEDSEDFIEMVQEAMKKAPYFQKKQAEECAVCPWQYYCRGGCTVHVKCAGKQAGSIDEIECAVNRALYPLFVETILEHPEKINRLLERRACIR